MQRQLRGLDYRTQHSLYTCSGGSMRKPLQLYSRNAITYVATNLRYRDIYAWSPDTVNKPLILIKKNFNFYVYNTKIIIFLKYYILLYLTFKYFIFYNLFSLLIRGQGTEWRPHRGDWDYKERSVHYACGTVGESQ